MSVVKVSVSVDEQQLDQFPQVVEEVKQAGMKVEQQLKDIGVITGSIDSEKLKSLRKVKGVAHIEESREFQIAPPDRDIQ
jgi:hypothetical protein